MSAAWIPCAQAQSGCLRGSRGCLVAYAAPSVLPPAVAPPTSRLRPAAQARIAQSVAGEALRGDRIQWMLSSGAGELEGGRSGPGLSERILVTTVMSRRLQGACCVAEPLWWRLVL